MSGRDHLPAPGLPDGKPAPDDPGSGTTLGPAGLATLMQVLACGIVVQNAQGHIVDCNPAAERLLGLSRDQMTGLTSIDPRWRALDGDECELPGDQHPAMHTLRTGEPVDDFEMGICLPDGQRRWIVVNTRPMPMPGATWVVASFEETTARKQAEQEARRAHAMLQGLFELMPVGISLMDMTTGRAAGVNDALCTMLGYTRDEMLGMDLSVCTPPALRAERGEKFLRALDQGHCGTYETVLLHRSGRAVNVLRSGARVVSPDGRPHVWSVAQDITARKAMEQQMLAAATLDRLTGLPNRATLMGDLDALSRRARAEPGFRFAVLFLDFDRFKLVNDTLGHAAGDELLCAVAERVLAVATTPGMGGTDWRVARFGGDEFVVLAPGLATPEAARELGTHLFARLEQPYRLQGRDIHSSASIGVAFSQGGGTRAEVLMRDADTAMYEAKHAGRATLVVFDDTMRSRLTRAVQIEAALRGAHLRGEMQVVYQPIVDLETARFCSAEALLRWHHPELGTVSPAEFIPIAEDSGSIVALGEWVLRQACAQWVQWQRQEPQAAPASISVNLSRRQMVLEVDLLRTVREALDAVAMPADALQLEVTEREIARASSDTRTLMQALHAMGVKLAMDDFGTGASSLGFLRDYPFHAIKIDKSFVTDLCRDTHVLAVAHATIHLVENLGLVSVAEGVTEPGELATLQSLGCRCGQGYLFGQPMPGDALLAAARQAAA